MAFFEDFGKKLSQTGQEAAKKAKDLADITKLNIQIDTHQKTVNSLYNQIGTKYYELYAESAQGELAEFCAKLKEAKEKIAGLQEQIDKIKNDKHDAAPAPAPVEEVQPAPATEAPAVNAGPVCPECGAQVETGTVLDASCEAKISEPEQSQEIPAEEAPQPVCSGCGTPLPLGAAFCSNCGQKAEG